MSNIYINQIQNTFRTQPWFSQRGPVLCGQQFVDRFEQMMLVFEYEVANGTYLQEVDIPFGMFVTVKNGGNSNKARLMVMMAPKDENGDPVFRIRQKKLRMVNEFICGATQYTQIVAAGTSAQTGADVWESEVTPYDERHVESTYVAVTAYTSAPSQVYDDALKVHHEVVKELVQTKGTGGLYPYYTLLVNPAGTNNSFLLTAVTPDVSAVTFTMATPVVAASIVVAVVGSAITVTPTTTSTAAQVITAINAFPAAAALVVATASETVSGVVAAVSVAPLSLTDTTQYSFIDYASVKCGWWVKTAERLTTGTKYSLCGMSNYSWPPVLVVAPTLAFMDAYDEEGNTYPHKVIMDQLIKDGYSGPCKSEYTVAFLSAMPDSCPAPTQMVTSSVDYQGMLFDYNLPECLHGALNFTESTGSADPRFPYQTRTRSFAATSPTDWPNSVTADYDVKPYKGGFLVTALTIYKPA